MLFFHVPHSWHQRFKVTFRLNGKALGLVSLFNTFYYIHAKVRLRAVSYFSFESQWTGIAQSTREGRGTRVINFFARHAWLWGKKGDRSRSTKEWFSRLDQLNCFLPFCPNLSNCQSECEVCCSDVNVIPNLSIVPKKLVMVTLKLTELHSENRPILPCKQRFLSCLAFSLGSRSRRFWQQQERLKNNRFKGDVTRDDSQRRFLAQHSVAMLEQCCNYSKQCRNNVATLCCAKNRTK